jgi:hypothetical protein
VRDAADLAGTMTAIIAAAGEGAISPDEGGRLARLVQVFELPSNPVLLSTAGLLTRPAHTSRLATLRALA